MSNAAMLRGYAQYIPQEPHVDHRTVFMPIGTRAHRLYRMPWGWRLWIATRDYVYGNYLDLHSSGRVVNVTARRNEGDEWFVARPSDEEIWRRTHD